jgi:hypothetical protein
VTDPRRPCRTGCPPQSLCLGRFRSVAITRRPAQAQASASTRAQAMVRQHGLHCVPAAAVSTGWFVGLGSQTAAVSAVVTGTIPHLT